jgi:ACS family tartrate transporter-like MFS transporter
LDATQLANDPGLPERARRRISRRLIPWLFFLYILAYLDRVNISAAALGMGLPPEKGGLGFTTEFIGFASGIFFWGYWILEIPSTVSVVKWGARWVFVRILVLWGVCATLCGFLGKPILATLLGWIQVGGFNVWGHSFTGVDGTQPADQLVILRFLLGFFEGGFFPSVIVYLALWFRPEDRARAIASFMSAIPIASIIGLPFSSFLSLLDMQGLEGWRWILIIEGIAPIGAGVLTLFFLPDRPEKAAWLPSDECRWLRDELDREDAGKLHHGHFAWVRKFGTVLLLTSVYFCLNVSSYGLGMFMPKILQLNFHIEKSMTALTILVAALPFIPALICMRLNGWHSDRSGERVWHVAIPLFLQGVGVAAAAYFDGVGLVSAFIMILWVGSCLYAHLPAFWPIPRTFLGVVVAASAVGFINMIGNLGGSVGPYIVGKAAEGQSTFAPALWKIAPFPIVGAFIIIAVGHFRGWMRFAAKICGGRMRE